MANESVWFRRQLEYIKAETYDTKQKPLRAQEVIPVSTESPMGTESITYESYTHVGIAKIINDYATDFPRCDVYGDENSVKVKGIGSSFAYSRIDMIRSQRTGKNLNGRKADSCRRGNLQKIDNIAWFGLPEYGIQGLFDYPGITEYVVENGASGNTEWETKTPDEINKDLEGLISISNEITNDVAQPNLVLLPTGKYNYIKGIRMTDGNDKSVLTYFLEQNPDVTVRKINELKDAGAGGSARMMAYEASPRVLTLEIPEQFMMDDFTQEGMTFTVPCYSETAGVICYYPLEVAFGDGI